MPHPSSGSVPITNPLRRVLRFLVPGSARRLVGAIRRLPPSARPVYLRWWFLSRTRRAAPLPAARTIRTMVFVCHGNIMRSPMAAALLARRLGERHVPPPHIESAGLHAKRGAKPPDMARDAAIQFAISLEDHEARPLDRELVRRADVLVVMDLLNAAELAARWPDAAPRIRLLGPIGPNGRVEISDPYGTSIETTVHCYEQIATAIDAIALHFARGASERGG